ncbi:hypothetical protein J1614_000614 [Plenodomus biglobosus]|nr:hypothetical protein J1614_000614 [Plenodomus biglobosus]
MRGCVAASSRQRDRDLVNAVEGSQQSDHATVTSLEAVVGLALGARPPTMLARTLLRSFAAVAGARGRRGPSSSLGARAQAFRYGTGTASANLELTAVHHAACACGPELAV